MEGFFKTSRRRRRLGPPVVVKFYWTPRLCISAISVPRFPKWAFFVAKHIWNSVE